MTKLQELREKRGRQWDAMKAINDKVLTESRSYTAEENTEYGRLETELDATDVTIRRAEKVEAEERKMVESAAREAEARAAAAKPETTDARPATGPTATPEYRAAYERYIRDGIRGPELRASLQADSGPDGGYLTAPPQTINGLIQALDDELFIRKLATKFTLTGTDTGFAPSLDTDVADAEWTSELQTGSETTAVFGKRELHAHPLAKRIKISRKLLRLTAGGAEKIVMDRFRYKFALTEEKAFLTGHGSQQPLGVFTASEFGIPTSRDVSTSSTTTAFTADSLIDAQYSLKSQYMRNGTWLLHRDAVKMARKLKDGNGQYLWAPAMLSGQPDTINDRPFYMSEWAPNTFTTGLYYAIYGDFSFYWIVDSLGFELQRLNELYAETNQVGFIGRLEVDGAPVLAEAFVRLKLA